MTPPAASVKKMIWVNIIFFAVTTLAGVIGAPIYIYKYGLAPDEMALFAFFMAATGLGITVGYHRFFSHATFKAHPVIKFLLLFFGAAAFEQSAYDWSSQHRDHHRFVDTERDPYSIKKGFWYAHIGWLIFWKHVIHYENAKDLARDPMVMHQHRYYGLWAVGSGIVLPVLIGAIWGHALSAFLLSVCLRLTLVYHSTFFINSICHMFGRATYDIYATAKDHWLIAFVTYGEGYHNFHHRFPSDYRNGVRWYQWDPSKWLIASLNYLGLAWDLRRVSRFKILDARLKAERQRSEDWLMQLSRHPLVTQYLSLLKTHYDALRARLDQWESLAGGLKDNLERCSSGIAQQAENHVRQARQNFESEEQRWNIFIKNEVRPFFVRYSHAWA